MGSSPSASPSVTTPTVPTVPCASNEIYVNGRCVAR
jgi:hypothetical protein